MLKKIFLAGAIIGAAMLGSASAASAQYAAIAIGNNQVVGWADGYRSMESARAAAVRDCRNYGGGSCSANVAERSSWFYSAGYCNGVPYAATSPQGFWRSDELVFWKGSQDGYYNCWIAEQH